MDVGGGGRAGVVGEVVEGVASVEEVSVIEDREDEVDDEGLEVSGQDFRSARLVAVLNGVGMITQKS